MKLEELLKLLNENPEILKGVITHILTLPEGKEVLENYAKQETPKIIEAAKADIFKGLDGKLATVLGAAKPEGTDFEAYLEKIGAELKTLKDNAGKTGDETSRARIAQLEAEVQAFKTANWEGKYNSLVTDTAKKLEEYDTKYKTLETSQLEAMVSADLAGGFAKLAFNPNIPKEAIDAMAEKVKDTVLKSAKIVEGKVVYYNADGTPMNNETFKPISAEEIYRKNLSTVIAEGKGGGKAPSNPGQSTQQEEGKKGAISVVKEGDKELKKLVLDPKNFNTKLSFAQHAEEVLIGEGVERGSKDWNDMIQAARTEYGVESMERV